MLGIELRIQLSAGIGTVSPDHILRNLKDLFFNTIDISLVFCISNYPKVCIYDLNLSPNNLKKGGEKYNST